MVIIGLTGSVGMGKSTAADMFRAMRIPVCDSDALVHGFMGPNGQALPAIGDAFPGVVGENGVDRAALGQIVFNDTAALRRLEGILHPMVWNAQEKFLRSATMAGNELAVLDVPLLFEGKTDRRCDVVVVVTAPAFLQRQRVMRRPGMTEERFQGTLAHQMSDFEKRKRADFVVQTGLGRHVTFMALKAIVADARALTPRKWRPGWVRNGERSGHA